MDIPLDNIEPNPWNPRTTFEDTTMQELADSIKRFGVLQPICVRPHPAMKEKYQIVYGQRRWSACRKLGLKTIPVKEPILPISDKDAIDMMGDENVKREAYSPVELARYFEIRNKILGEKEKEIAKRFEIHEDYVSDIKQLTRLPEEIKSKVAWSTPTFVRGHTEREASLTGSKPASITFSHARQILRVPEKEKQLELAEKIEKEGLTVSQVRKEVERELGIEHAEISLPPISDQIHNKVMWNLDRIDLKPYQFFTIGYSERNIEQFVEVLKSAGVKTLIDVRDEPYSMHKPEFNKENLDKVLKQNKIQYIHHSVLGVPKAIRVELSKTGNWSEFFKWYDENVISLLEGPELEGIIDFGSMNYPIAIMCVELDPTKCHRHRIALSLEKRDLKGIDL
ncbi:MAG: ParB/RepB/Spo0J family partition protein [Candidatus Bathyarchaeota archaeon]|nr:ParB/RepB/Spo0J family partition protein [Candidatus Bathyarchaeota archaeon]MDH5788780.1 ParB/RepB/Spo0J family partition protein [Candidatus Bathyarchaeota archaeon]